MMKDYNGFSGKQRERAQRWLNKEWNARRLKISVTPVVPSRKARAGRA